MKLGWELTGVLEYWLLIGWELVKMLQFYWLSELENAGCWFAESWRKCWALIGWESWGMLAADLLIADENAGILLAVRIQKCCSLIGWEWLLVTAGDCLRLLEAAVGVYWRAHSSLSWFNECCVIDSSWELCAKLCSQGYALLDSRKVLKCLFFA